MNDRTPWYREHAATLATILFAIVGLYFGWRLFWFLTDDAFIAFRYVHNEIVGRGLVWNPAPFRPVEGYTSFLWVLLLDVVWRGFGVEPPVAANWLSLGFGYLTLGVVCHVLFELELPARYRHLRPSLFALAFAGFLSNRTFLAALSSGLETSLFNFLVSAWLASSISSQKSPTGRRWSLTVLAAALLALARPDGLLFCAGTAIGVALWQWRRRRPQELWCLSPLCIVLAHLLWRHATYGTWLPNTYHAKYTGAWPESGARYLGSFVIEYALYVPLALWLAALMRKTDLALRLSWLALTILAAHLTYYTLVVGGDHFEYRVYSHLVPWCWVAMIVLAVRLFPNPSAGFPALLVGLLLSLPVPWLHWLRSHEKQARADTEFMVITLSWAFPPPFSFLVKQWDDWQAWLIEHYVCMRHQEHKVFGALQLSTYPDRRRGLSMQWDEHNVYVINTTGVPGWILPNAAVIDTHGLNDFVIARTPPNTRGERHMAHDRWPPHGYVACFEPNVSIEGAAIIVRPRPLSDTRIRECERSFAAALPEHP